jgi:hypothetical protein
MRSRARVLWAGAISVVATVMVVGVSLRVAAPADTSPPRTRPVTAYAATPGARALAVLRRWDRQRADAWAAGDPAALARLYVTGSRTGLRDVRDLERWRGRGLRVTGLRQQVAALSVRRRTPGRLTVLVTDRTVDGVAVGGRYRLGVPRSAWQTHRITLRHDAGRWRVVEARVRPGR